MIVTGMHRTGSSAMARLLSLAGASLPARLLEPSAGNPRGHWEPREVVRLDDAMLTSLGSDWCDPRAFRLEGGRDLCNPYWLDRAHRVITEDFGGADRIVLKDPRTALLLNFWRRAVSEFGLAPRVVIMVRDPHSVARSLQRRDGFPFGQSVLMWMSYMLAAERDSRGGKRAFVAYDELLDDWRGVLDRLEAAFGTPLSAQASTVAAEIDAFLDVQLRHFAATPHAAGAIWDKAHEVGLWFAAAARGEAPSTAVLDAATAELEGVMTIVAGALENLRGDRDRLERRIAALGG